MRTIIFPPELLSIIVQHAAECDSTRDSYKKRLRTLSALSLVSRTFRELAQPLLAQKVHCTRPEELAEVLSTELAERVHSLTFGETLNYQHFPRLMNRFVNLTRLRVINGSFDLETLGRHQHLATLAIERCSLEGWIDLILPHLVEFSIDHCIIMIPTGPSGEGSVNFLSTARFPSLRALALQRVGYQGPGRESLSVDFRLASQLDCIVADRVYPTSPTGDPHHPTSPASLDYPIPCLFDLASFHKTTSWGNPSIPSYPKLSQTHVRVRLSCKPTPSRFHVQTALSLMRTLLVHSTVLKKLYLDLFPRNGKGGYVLDEDSEEKMARLEIQARKKNVEIIWESHKDDWCASLMSKEFWRRSKEKKQRENEGNHR